MTDKKNRGGRPATGHDPARILARVSDAEWSELKSAAARTGKTFSEWALSILLRAARRTK